MKSHNATARAFAAALLMLAVPRVSGASTGCVNSPTTGLPDPHANPFYSILTVSAGLDARNSGPQISARIDRCDGENFLSRGLAQTAGDKSGSLSVAAHAGLNAGVQFDASYSGPSSAAGAVSITLHNEVTMLAPPNGAPAGTPLHGYFDFGIEGSNTITAGSGAGVSSVVEFDAFVRGTDQTDAWFDEPNGTPTTTILRPIGPSSSPQKILFHIPGIIRVGETVGVTITIDAQGSATGAGPNGSHGVGSASFAQGFNNTASFRFVTDDPTVVQHWASDALFSGAQPTLTLVPLPATWWMCLPATGAILARARRRCGLSRKRTPAHGGMRA